MFLERIYERRKHTDLKENRAGLLMGMIPVLAFLIFGFVPIILGIVMSFFDFGDRTFFSDQTKFVGFTNYVHCFIIKGEQADPLKGMYFLETLITTVVMYISVPACIVLSLLVAFFLSKKIKGKTFFRTVFLLPFVCSSIAITFIWGRVFDTNLGILNQLLIHKLGMSPNKYQAYDWVGNHFYEVLFLINVWGGCGFNIILYTAALTNVNTSYYEAAQVDGANPFQIFFKITVPAISPTTFYLFITATIGALQTFPVPDMVGRFTAAKSGEVLGVLVHQRQLTVVGYMNSLLHNNIRTGVASAIAVMLSIIIGVVTIINFIGQKYWVNYD